MEDDPIEILDDDYLEMGDEDIEFIRHRPITQNTVRQRHITTRVGDNVQFSDRSFMRITGYDMDDRDRVLLKGYKLVAPTIQTECIAPEKNELVWQQRYSVDGSRIHTHVTRLASDVIRNCQIIFTNQVYKVINYNNDLHERPVNTGELFFCRLKRVLPSQKNFIRKSDQASRHLRGSIELLRAEEADDGHRMLKDFTEVSIRISNAENRTFWRGPTIPGGSSTFQAGNRKFQQYTVGDCFSGAGGTSHGAYGAGLRISWAFDFNEMAMSSYAGRFDALGTECLLTSCTDFLELVRADPEKYKVDIVHMSPPCKPFSAANTTPNEELNATNHAVFTVVEDIIRYIKPRIVTIEQADALEWPTRRPWFVKGLSMFTSLGYSVRWEVVELSRYGVPQTRKRLIMIGSCPGEKLPSFPMATHGTRPGLHPPPSIAGALQNIPWDATHHELWAVRRFSAPKPPLNAYGLSGTIKCGGNSENVYYPDGTRGYTVREMARLQTFPDGFNFVGSNTQIIEQIGNAVPPRAAEAWFSEIRRSLFQSDREEMWGHGAEE